MEKFITPNKCQRCPSIMKIHIDVADDQDYLEGLIDDAKNGKPNAMANLAVEQLMATSDGMTVEELATSTVNIHKYISRTFGNIIENSEEVVTESHKQIAELTRDCPGVVETSIMRDHVIYDFGICRSPQKPINTISIEECAVMRTPYNPYTE